MLTKDDLLDIIMERLGQASSGLRLPLPTAPPKPLDQELRGRLFLSEYDIKKRLTQSAQELRIPRDSIISPLATDWLTLRRIRIVRE